MKSFKKIGSQFINTLLLGVYLFIALTHIFFLPNLNKEILKLSASSTTEFIHKSHNQNNGTSLLHRGIRSVIDGKRKSLVPKTTACIPLLAFIFSAVTLLFLAKKPELYSSPIYTIHPDAYLKQRSLRI
ncbi:hypothetical protein [Mucilaginibacter sp. FT3.2]|uniref:hypothetical protein n=1 Tax=Mucilaginibacter sp. FT3.2 TaxID=2723090 RepID=UPI00161B3A58|nr:hypothetical protein [Mucilaginibacter sp. FT3.2]MBB6231517.1 hypothetical protein [Mucilaginibacter sp. FT3.2]